MYLMFVPSTYNHFLKMGYNMTQVKTTKDIIVN